MTQDWGSLPLIPLRYVLKYLSVEDAIAAMSTCRHWRSAIQLYEGQKETVKLRAKQIRRATYLTRLFRKYTKNLHIYLDGNEDEVDKVMNHLLPQYFETVELRELIIIGPCYIHQNKQVPLIKLKRIQIESLFFKNIHCMVTFALMGCELDVANDNEKKIHKSVELYSRGLLYSRYPTISAVNVKIHPVSSMLRHLVVDYTQLNTGCLVSLEPLRQLRYITLNVTTKRMPNWPSIEWRRVHNSFDDPLEVALNIVAVPCKRFNEIMENVLVDGVHLVSLKVMFCKSLYTPLLSHVSRMYQHCLREVVWVDCPNESSDPYHRIVRPIRQMQPDHFAHVNPFVLLCWQCIHLRRLTIHGYWTWHYDLLGFVRLRKTLTHLEISSVYNKQGQFGDELQMSEEGTVRVMLGDPPTELDDACIDEVNEYTEFKWRPIPVRSLHPGLRARATAAQRLEYVLRETRRHASLTY